MGYLNQAHRIQLYAETQYFNVGRSHPVIDYFMAVSAQNKAINMNNESFLAAPGKKRTVQFNYWPGQCEIEGECNQSLCATGTTIQPTEQTFTINQCTATKKFSLRLEDLRSIDYNQWNVPYIADTIIETAMPAARKLLADDMLTYALTKVGVHTDGNATKQLKLLNTATGAINPMGWLKLKQEYMDAGQDQPYSLGGGSEVFAISQLQGSAGLNQLGVNTGAVQVPNLWYDEGMIGSIKGDVAAGNYIMSIDPRMFKVISYTNNAGIFRTDLDSISDAYKLFSGTQGHDFILGTFRDPVTGIIWDLYLNFEKCGTNNKPEWSFHLEHWWDMFVAPPINCNIAGYNGLTLWRTCPEVEEACPTGISPVSPTFARVYTATPTLAEIPTISQSSIGGINNTQEEAVPISTVADLVAYMNANYGGQAIFQVSGSNVVYSGVVDLTVTFNNGDYELQFT